MKTNSEQVDSEYEQTEAIIAERKNGIITIRAVQRTGWNDIEKQQMRTT